MTLSKTARRSRDLKQSASELQAARDGAYSAILHLYTLAENHAVLCESVAVEEGNQVVSKGLERQSKRGSWWPGNVEVESIIHHALQTHRIIGRSAWSKVELPFPERKVPPPTGATRTIK